MYRYGAMDNMMVNMARGVGGLLPFSSICDELVGITSCIGRSICVWCSEALHCSGRPNNLQITCRIIQIIGTLLTGFHCSRGHQPTHRSPMTHDHRGVVGWLSTNPSAITARGLFAGYATHRQQQPVGAAADDQALHHSSWSTGEQWHSVDK